MTDAINTQNRLQHAVVKPGTQAKSETPSSQAARKDSSSADASAIVNLSSSNLLQELGDQIRQLPDANAVKIDAIKQALTRGEYQINAETIAQKFVDVEKLLP